MNPEDPSSETPSGPHSPRAPSRRELHALALAARMHVYELERLGYTDAANIPAGLPAEAGKRRAALRSAMRHWVLSRF